MINKLSKLFGILSVITLSAAVLFAVAMKNTPSLTVGSWDAADFLSEQFMEAVCCGNYADAEAMLIGSPVLHLEQGFTNPLSERLWDAYISTLSYTFHGSCYSSDHGLYRDVTLTILDIPTLLTDLQKQSVYLPAFSSAAEMNILAEAVQDTIESGSYTTTRTLTLQLMTHRGKWKISPTVELIDLMQGSMGGT